MTDREDKIQVLYGKESTWAQKNLVLAKGEHGYEWDTNRFKIGDDVTPYSQLEYFIPESQIAQMIAEAVAAIPPGGSDGGITPVMLEAHINSSSPHPVYDDGPSLLLLYQNAKV